MYVNLRRPVLEVVDLVIDGMVEGQLDQLVVWEYSCHFAAERLIHPVVIVRVQEAAGFQIVTQPPHLFVREGDIAVPGHVQERVLVQLLVEQAYLRLVGGYAHVGAGVDLLGQIGNHIRVIIPVSTAVVLQASDLELREPDATQQRSGKKHPSCAASMKD